MKKSLLAILFCLQSYVIFGAGNVTIGSGSGTGTITIQSGSGGGSSTGGAAIYPATGTASFPYGFSASTITVNNTSTSNGFYLNQTGNAGKSYWDGSKGGALVIDKNFVSATDGLVVISSQATQTSIDSLAHLISQTTSYNEIMLWIQSNSTSTIGANADIRIDANNPDIEMQETDHLSAGTGNGKWEIAVNFDQFQINQRNATDSSFQNILSVARDGSLRFKELDNNNDFVAFIATTTLNGSFTYTLPSDNPSEGSSLHTHAYNNGTYDMYWLKDIQNQDTLQAGATFFVSKGTIRTPVGAGDTSFFIDHLATSGQALRVISAANENAAYVESDGDAGNGSGSGGNLFINNTFNPGIGLQVYSGNNTPTSTNGLVFFKYASLNATTPLLRLDNSGTGNSIKIVEGNSKGNILGSSGSILIDNTQNTGIGLQIYSGTNTATGALLEVMGNDTSWASPIAVFESTSSASTAINLRLKDYNPDLEFQELGQTSPAGKMKIDLQNDQMRFLARNSVDNSYELGMKFNPVRTGMFLELESTGTLRLNDADNSRYVQLKASDTVTNNLTFVLPATDGTNGQALITNGAGNLSFTTISGGSGGASTLAIGTGTASNFTTNVTSPTAAISFLGSQFASTTNGTTNFVSLKSIATAGSYGSTTIAPVITINAQGQVTSLSSATIAGGGGGSPGGSTGQLQYNNAGSFGGINGSTFNLTGSPMLALQSQSASTVTFVVQGAASQSADIQQWQNNSGTAISEIDSRGIFSSIVGTGNFFIGPSAGNTTLSGIYNTAIGNSALPAVTSGGTNVALGLQALLNNTSGSNNMGIGYGALANNNGSSNCAVGVGALGLNISGLGNAAIGGQAGYSNTTGILNTYIGLQAGYPAVTANGNATGSNDIFIGYGAGPGTSSQIDSSVAIGNGALVSVSHQIVFGTSAETVLMPGGATIQTGGSSNKGLIIQGAASQSANIQQWQDFSGIVLSSVAANGNITASTITAITAFVFSDGSSQTTAATSGGGSSDGNNFNNYTATKSLSMGSFGITSIGTSSSSFTSAGGLVVKSTFTPSQGFHWGGLASFSSNITLTSTHTIILASATTSAGITITLPTAANIGQELTIKKVDGSTWPVTIIPAGSDVIETTNTIKLFAKYQQQTLTADGATTWMGMNGISHTPAYAGPAETMGTIASAVGVSSTAYLSAFTLENYCAMTGVRVGNNGASGNIDVGIYDQNFNRLGSSGSQTVVLNRNTYPLTSVVQLIPGQYWLAMSPSDATASWSRRASALGIGNISKTVSFPLPTTISTQADSSLGWVMEGICAGGQNQ